MMVPHLPLQVCESVSSSKAVDNASPEEHYLANRRLETQDPEDTEAKVKTSIQKADIPIHGFATRTSK
jgi:hypothetical protein